MVVEKSIQFLLSSLRQDESQCCWPIDTNLATWGTTLAINGIANDTEALSQVVLTEPGHWLHCINWVLSCQNKSVHPFTGAAPGGWGWTDLSGAVPDADDTPGALIALKHFYDLIRRPDFRAKLPNQFRISFGKELEERILSAADAGLKWLVDLQNRDRGWPTFCRGWGKLPFDRSGADLTAHALRALHMWKPIQMASISSDRISKSVQRGFDYLQQNQHPEGFWLPLWFGNQDLSDDINPCYGTAKVLQAYFECDLIDTPEAQNGLKWILSHQNDDGGFGGGPSVRWKNVSLGSSTVEETALCAEALLTSINSTLLSADDHDAAKRAVDWLEEAVKSDSITTFNPIGFYFAKLWYHERLYPLVFSIAALARDRSTVVRSKPKQPHA
jgi:squalene-hopene/tetraprenyl-beta-curcumene cyclase